MSHIILTTPAAGELARDWPTGGDVPLLFYYRRCYSALKDGTTVEHGDGFGLSRIDPKETKDTEEVVFERAELPNRQAAFVRIPRSMLASKISIGWSNGKFTLE